MEQRRLQVGPEGIEDLQDLAPGEHRHPRVVVIICTSSSLARSLRAFIALEVISLRFFPRFWGRPS